MRSNLTTIKFWLCTLITTLLRVTIARSSQSRVTRKSTAHIHYTGCGTQQHQLINSGWSVDSEELVFISTDLAQVYTACMDIDIETLPEAKMSSQRTAPTSASSFSSIAVTVPAAQRSQVSVTIDISPELREGDHEPTCTTSPELGPSPITTTTRFSTEQISHMRAGPVKNPTKLHSPSSRRLSSLELPTTHGSSHALTSTISRSQSPTQSPTVSGLMHSVEVNFNNRTSFNRSHLEDIPIGDSVVFWFNGVFNLYNTTFEHPCAIMNEVQRFVLDPIYIFPVTTTDPVWFFACPVGEDCYCDRNAHFALNAGPLREQYFNNAAATAVVIKTTTLQEDLQTVYSTTTVTTS